MALLQTIPKRLAVDEIQHLNTQFPLGSNNSWQSFAWETIDQNTGVQVTLFVAVPGTYICIHIDTQVIHHRVKARDILRDNYRKLYGDLRGLHVVGYCDVKHREAYDAMRNAFTVMDKARTLGEWTNIAPGEKGWEEAKHRNPFIIGMEKLLDENAAEIGHAFISKVWFIFEAGTKGSGGSVDHDLHMRIELMR